MSLEKKWLFPLILTSACIFALGTTFNLSSLHTINSILSLFSPPEANVNRTALPSPEPAPISPPKFAYLISGSTGDLDKLWRTLHALYHPWNYYVLHLDLESPIEDRLELIRRVRNHTLFARVGNVYAVRKSNMVTYRGPTMVANTLHAAAILLRRYGDWDWFINLSASDYPLVTQDGAFYLIPSALISFLDRIILHFGICENLN